MKNKEHKKVSVQRTPRESPSSFKRIVRRGGGVAGSWRGRGGRTVKG